MVASVQLLERPRMVRRPRAIVHAAGIYRRCDQPVDAAALCADRIGIAYFEATRGYIEQHGKPVAFYSDKASIQAKGRVGSPGSDVFAHRVHYGLETNSPNSERSVKAPSPLLAVMLSR